MRSGSYYSRKRPHDDNTDDDDDNDDGNDDDDLTNIQLCAYFLFPLENRGLTSVSELNSMFVIFKIVEM